MSIKGLILFDIDGVIRDVSNSYRMAIIKTVKHYCFWEPSIFEIDEIKNEGIWNNDWDLSLELIKRHIVSNRLTITPPTRKELVCHFENLYFGLKSPLESEIWTGFIKNEKILIEKNIFSELTKNSILWGFVSGAERASAEYILKNKLKLLNPPLVAMGEAPDKPDPKGFICLSKKLLNQELGRSAPPIAYIGDTVADVKTIINSRKKIPAQKFISLAVSPPHLHLKKSVKAREIYESKLKIAGADFILNSVNDIKNIFKELFF